MAGSPGVAVQGAQAGHSLGTEAVNAAPRAGAVGVLDAVGLLGQAGADFGIADELTHAGAPGVTSVEAVAIVADAALVAVGGPQARVAFGADPLNADAGARAVGVLQTL